MQPVDALAWIESVTLEETIGEWDDVIGHPIEVVEESSNSDNPPEHADSFTWTFYTIRTNRGTVTLRWLGQSNGYYSESVDFERAA